MANVHGLNSNRGRRGGGGGGDGDEEGQNMFAGGAGQGGSGLNVVGPGGDGPADPLERIVQRAREDTAGRGAPADGGPPANSVRVTMYRNGFTVGDGPFRALDDPANAPFLADMARGFVPRELIPPGAASGDAAVDVELNDKRGDDYVPPAYTAFGGEGNSIGGGAAADEAAVVGAAASGDEVDLTVDESKPTTVIQIRTHDRRRLRGTFNLDMTVRHVQAFLRQEQGESAPYVLMAGYPPKRLTDFDATLEDAGLAKAQITQQLA